MSRKFDELHGWLVHGVEGRVGAGLAVTRGSRSDRLSTVWRAFDGVGACGPNLVEEGFATPVASRAVGRAGG
jgi:hypothetical protein